MSPFENLCLTCEFLGITRLGRATGRVPELRQQLVDTAVDARRIGSAAGVREVLAWKWY
ncbi:hypothetical protein DEU38_1214 [Rhodococcus sp. AG1013]|uniref:hypothetical protein n=1 Tax=Rhodococcus sp. AG1013 TaxID=2183996 RepID=UPI000E2DD981|nr:hypothetical protein [Rhodococcus sp. AG1013]RDI17969.1 hypothetical protein DEU38_1214 [Rhodococcus sp. AG1013]